MVDNVVINTGLPATIATDDVGGGVQIQRVRLDAGAEGTSLPVNGDNPLPIEIASDVGLTLLRRLVKAVDSLQTVDSQQRQRVTIDAGTLPTVTAVTTVATVTTCATVSTITNAVPVGNIATLAGVDIRYQFIDAARAAYNSGVRTGLVFS